MRSAADRTPPANVELEQIVLGAVLLNNQALGEIALVLSRDDFSKEWHRRIFEVASSLIGAGQAATPTTLKTFLGDHDIGGGVTVPQYLARLAAAGMPAFLARDYASSVRDLATRRKIITAAEELAAQAYDLPVSVRPAQIAGEAITILHALATSEGALSTRREMHNSAATVIETIRSMQESGARRQIVTTGFADLDKATGGYKAGDLWVVGARPGQGKTILFVSSASKVARSGFGVKGFALEVGEQQITARALADLAYSSRQPISFKSIMDQTVTPEELRRLDAAHDRLRSMPLIVDVASRLSAGEIRIRVRAERERMAAKGQALRVIFIDYLKQVQASDRYRGNRVYEVGEISAALKQLAKDEGVCVVLLAQLNRGLEAREDKRPSLADLRESGDLEADADVVAFIHRESAYIERTPEYRASDPKAIDRFFEHQNKAEIIIGKNRAGPTRTVELWCDVACSTMSDYMREASH